MSTPRNRRILLLVNSLSKYSTGAWQLIYSFTEASAIVVTQNVLGDDYKSITVIKGQNATKARFLAALQAAATTSGVTAVDVFCQLHGTNGRFYFYDNPVLASVLRNDILALNLPDKLRLFYNTGCYGDSQNRPAMIEAGFAATIGSVAINCTGATEFPTFCSMWQNGNTVKKVMATADLPAQRVIQDGLAKAMQPIFSDANSKKLIRGNANLTIST